MSTGVTHQNGLYPEALPERGVFFVVVVIRLPEYKRIGASLVEVYETVQKSVISI